MYYMHDSFELALHLCGIKAEDENYANSDNVDPILYAKYGIEDTDKFNDLIKDLVDLITVLEKTMVLIREFNTVEEKENHVEYL